VRVIYGDHDRVLPDVAQTMARVKTDVPHAEVTTLPGRGHFIQEEAAEEVGELLARFFATSRTPFTQSSGVPVTASATSPRSPK
jgi:pimeloyl-ACP methyl ester carboxylesterase